MWFDRVVENGRVVHVRTTWLYGRESRTCSLRFAERGPLTLDQVGRILGLTRERVRQIELAGLRELRESDMGVLRDLLDGINEMQSEDETWTDGWDAAGATDDEATDRTDVYGDLVVDDTLPPDGADDPVYHETGLLPWSEPSSTDPRIRINNERRIERAAALAAEAPEYRCPYCDRTFPGVCIDGRARRGCPDPRCAGHAWGDRARERHRFRQAIPPEVIAAIRAEYRPGERGYRLLAREHGLPLGPVAKVLRGDRRRER